MNIYRNIFEYNGDAKQNINILNNDMTLFDTETHDNDDNNIRDNSLDIQNSDTKSGNIRNDEKHIKKQEEILSLAPKHFNPMYRKIQRQDMIRSINSVGGKTQWNPT